jgi:hypothetical protein
MPPASSKPRDTPWPAGWELLTIAVPLQSLYMTHTSADSTERPEKSDWKLHENMREAEYT